MNFSTLLAFRAENVRSYRDGLELSLLATPLAEKGVPRIDEAIGRRYVAGRYGATPVLADEEFAEVALSTVRDPR